jgi:hypothetical protein
MATRDKWDSIPPVQFTTTARRGEIVVLDPSPYRVGMRVTVKKAAEVLGLRVNLVTPTALFLGPVGSDDLRNRFDLNEAGFSGPGLTVEVAEQEIPELDPKAIHQYAHERDPANAYRALLVDQLGRAYTSDNPMFVQLSDGSITIDTVNANLSVQLSHEGEDHDSVRVGDGEHLIAVNPDGSLNVNVVETAGDGPGLSYQHGEALAVPTGTPTTVLTVTAPTEPKRIRKIAAGGTNVATVTVRVGVDVVARKRLWYGAFDVEFGFEEFETGLLLEEGQVLTVSVEHERPHDGDFDATAYYT